MKIIDAIWEKRNLGVTCYELCIDVNDSLEEVILEYEKLVEKQYMVVKVPSSRYDVTCFFQDRGYSFIEAAITLKHDLKNITIPNRLLRICQKCSWQMMDTDDLEQLSNEVKNNIFKTDRIYIDSQFTKQQAAIRYDFWIKDLVSQGHIPYKVCYAGEVVGFFLNKEIKKNVYDGLLAATYSDFEGSGMGYCVQYAGIQFALERGAKEYIGHISGNNPAVMRVLQSIGFSIKDIEYVFIKHSKGE